MSVNSPLNPRQLDLLMKLRAFVNRSGRAPTLGELSRRSGYSVGVIHREIGELEERGYVYREPGRWRSIRVREDSSLQRLIDWAGRVVFQDRMPQEARLEGIDLLAELGHAMPRRKGAA